ncbi:MAG: hypothetical protein ACOYLH_13125, partial [Flavobacteriales bacterium]
SDESACRDIIRQAVKASNASTIDTDEHTFPLHSASRCKSGLRAETKDVAGRRATANETLIGSIFVNYRKYQQNIVVETAELLVLHKLLEEFNQTAR